MLSAAGAEPMTRCAVLGQPIAHSLSPAMHRAAYAELGLDWRYDAYEVGEDELRSFLSTLGDDVRGLSLTMPLKRVALDLVDVVDPVAELIGAANTMLFEPDGSRSAHNTDVPGLVAAFAVHAFDLPTLFSHPDVQSLAQSNAAHVQAAPRHCRNRVLGRGHFHGQDRLRAYFFARGC